MVKDPFYRQIREALGSELNGDVFEKCANDLLLERFPTLVPMSGGNDGGVDGEIADGEGEPFPLICTTQERVIDNLTYSLERIRETGGRRRRIVVATSRVLSPKMRRDLRDRARELEFTLVQAYEQRAMAALLYRSSQWCRDLLHLTGKPVALSVLPPSLNRPLVEFELLGREKDAEWLRSTSGDRVLVGSPGVGKTYLLYNLALGGWGLFLASDDDGEIANAIRDQKPEVIVVDDSHTDPQRLEKLAGLRQRIGAEFSIVATTWEGHREDVVAALNIPSARAHNLEPLCRRQIQQIFEQLGVEALDEDLLELVDQASNKPGLAATLATLWLEGDWLPVLKGEALARHTLRTVRRLVGRDEAVLLSAFSLGGWCGMPTKEIREKLGMSALTTWTSLAPLTAAGVLSDASGGDCPSVQPPALRSALIASVFFPQHGPRLDYRDYLGLAPGYDCAVEEIAAAAAYGARISIEEIQQLLRRLDPADYPLRKAAQRAWDAFVSLGHQEALWAFEHYPGDFVDIARSGLDSAREATIRMLLERAEERANLGTSRVPQLDILRAWLHEITYSEDETIERRLMAIRVARNYVKAAQSIEAHDVAFRLVCLTLRPTVKYEGTDPTRTGIVRRHGPLSPLQAEQMRPVWRAALRLFQATGVVAVCELFSEIGEWRRLARYRRKTCEEEGSSVHQFVIEMLHDLASLATGRPGFTVALARLASELDIELPLDPDPRFEVLFPSLNAPDFEVLPNDPSLQALVEDWADASPAEVVETLSNLTQEAKNIPLGYYDRASDVCLMLAAKTRQPVPWFEVMAEKGVPGSWLAPFLERSRDCPGFEDRIRSCLRSERYAETGIRSALRLEEPSPELLTAALARAVDFPSLVRGMALRRELSTPVAKRLLAHPDPGLALEVAYGEWMADRQGEVRSELKDVWRDTVARNAKRSPSSRLHSYQLTELLSANPQLADEVAESYSIDQRINVTGTGSEPS